MATSLKQDLVRLRRLGSERTALNKKAKKKTKEFDDFERRCLDRMEREDIESLKTEGTLFSPTRDKIYGTVTDRTEFVRWALEQDEAINDFVTNWCGPDNAGVFGRSLIAAIMSTQLVEYKERGETFHALIRGLLDDGRGDELPPGTSFRTDDYISQRNS